MSALMLLPFASFAKEKEKTKSEKTLALEKKFKTGSLGAKGKEALASSLLKDDFSEEASALYNEILPPQITEQNKVNKINEATSLLKSKKIKAGVRKYNEIIDYLDENKSEDNEKLSKLIKSNLAKLFKQGQSGGKGEEKEENNNNQENSDQKQQGEGEGQESDNKDQKKDSEGEGEKKDKGDQSGDEKKKDEDKNGKKSESQSEKESRKKKLPALLKQLINDDNQMQKKMIDAKTTKRKNYGSKDW